MISQHTFIPYDIFNQRDTPVELTVTIGNGQLASTLIKINNDKLGDFNNSFSESLGKSSDLVRKTVNLFTTIHDINPDTNKVTMTVKLRGGKSEHEQTVIDSSVPTHGDIATALVTILLI